MLQKTFCHIQGIGETTERKIWRSGVKCWSDFLAAHGRGDFRGRKIEHCAAAVAESVEKFKACDWRHFDCCLPSLAKWRAFYDLGDRALYLDIETTGMGVESEITVIGTWDGRQAKSFVLGQNLDDALEEIENHPLVVTFNGAQFDMPVIRRRFQYNLFNHIHIDLRFPLKRLGFAGGLKKIEQAFGIERTDRTRGLDGWDAVRLWSEHLDGSSEALDLLLEYNIEDVKNLEPLMKYVAEELGKSSGLLPPQA